MRLEKTARANLDEVLEEVRSERGDAEAAAWRRLEAILGYDPGKTPDDEVEALLADAQVLGSKATSELAAARAEGSRALGAAELRGLADSLGIELRPAEAARLERPLRFAPAPELPAWRQGVAAAQALREQERLGEAPLSNVRLAELCGGSPQLLEPGEGAELSLALEDEQTAARIVLRRSSWQTSRRFALA